MVAVIRDVITHQAHTIAVAIQVTDSYVIDVTVQVCECVYMLKYVISIFGIPFWYRMEAQFFV